MSLLQNSNAISSGGYDINNSLRFRASASAYLNRTPASATNRKTWTWSAWVKLGLIQNQQPFFSVQSSTSVGSPNLYIYLGANGVYAYQEVVQTSTTWAVRTSAIYRDPSAWYHVVVAVDTTQATSANRVKIYVNGIQQSSLAVTTYPSLNYDTLANSTTAHNIGRVSTDGSAWAYADGYMAEVNFIDGSAKTPSDFGETDTDTGSWKPKAYTGTYGTNGFYLKFSDIATTSGSNAGLGKDFSGNANYWTTNNISVTAGTTYDAMIDSPTLTSETVANYAVLNPNWKGSLITISGANLNMVSTSSGVTLQQSPTTMAMPSGQYYFEVAVTTAANPTATLGVCLPTASPNSGIGRDANSWGYNPNGSGSSVIWYNGIGTNVAADANTGTFGVAFDADAGKLWFRNAAGNWISGDPAAGTSPSFSSVTAGVLPTIGQSTGGGTTVNSSINFGQRPFTYTPPTGYKALNTYNLPDSTIKKGNTVMDATLYTGTGATQVVTNSGSMKPDLVWLKSRSNARDHRLMDSVRGINNVLTPNSTVAEYAGSALSSINSNGFTLNTTDNQNVSAETYVGWQWQAGQGSTSSNTSGTITSTVSVNATAGFSVVTYTGTGSAATIGHGLGVVPKWIIVKNRDATDAWQVYHAANTANPETDYLVLNTTAATADNVNRWNDTLPTSTVFSIGNGVEVNTNTEKYVAYCWAEIAGFSKFGSYTGNGSTDGPFIYTGFRPKFILLKNASAAFGWTIWDTSRNTYNVLNNYLIPNASDAEGSLNVMDILSNGFKIRDSNIFNNGSGNTLIYAAFAENPFKNANAR
jgi:hypothetical protein